MKTQILTVRQAAQVLLDLDSDRAEELNGVGYRKGDGNWMGRVLKAPLTKKYEELVYQKLKIYKNQLSHHNIVWEELRKEVLTEEQDKKAQKKRAIYADYKTVKLENENFIIEFQYNVLFITGIKAFFKRRHFDGSRPAWIVPVDKNSIVQMQRFIKRYEFNCTINFENLIKDEKFNKTPLPDERIEMKKRDVFSIMFRYDLKRVEAVRQQPKRRFNPDNKSWEITVKGLTAQQAIIKLSEEFEWYLTEEVKDGLKEIKIEVEKREKIIKDNAKASRAMNSDFKIRPGLEFPLYPFQLAGVEYMIRNKKVVVADEMGLGKTIEVIAAVHHLESPTTLVIVPNTLKLNWVREWRKWIIKSKVSILESGDNIEEKLKEDFDTLICNYNAATKYVIKLTEFEFKVLVIDEGHYLKNSKAKRTKAIKKIAKKIEVVFDLTGTATVNRPIELVSQLDILGRLEDFGGAWNFMMRYCNGHRGAFGWDFMGASNTIELNKKLRKYCYVRREGKAVIDELPDLTRGIIELPINNRREYLKAEANLIEFLKGFSYSKEKIVEWVRKEQGISKEDYELLSDEEKQMYLKLYREAKIESAKSAEHLVRINALKQLTAKGKIKSVIEWIESFLEEGQKLVVFAHHTAIIKELSEYFKCNAIYGGVSTDDRQKYVDDFQENPNTKLIILNIATGSVGLTLTAASSLAFVELGWTPGEMSQAEKRIHRIGQKNHSNIYYLLGEKTIDVDIYELIEEKRNVTEAVNKGEVEKREVKILRGLIKRLTK